MVPAILIGLLGVGALVIDLGNVYIARQQLRVATQAAALAGAQLLNTSSASAAESAADNYSALTGDKNSNPDLAGVTMVSGSPKVECLSTTGVTCYSSSGSNAIVVEEQASVKTLFARLFGVKTVSISATATASAAGGGGNPFNVMIIVDTTASMNTSDINCAVPGVSKPSREDCALYGVRTLLGTLEPCPANSLNCPAAGAVGSSDCNLCGANVPAPVDEVGLAAFPGLTSTTQVGLDYDCKTTAPSTAAYSQTSPNPPVYQIVPLSSDYRASDTATLLNPNSDIVLAARGGSSSCNQGLDVVGKQGTFYADAITAAQATLVAVQSNRLSTAGVHSTNVIILVSDGDATSSATVAASKAKNECYEGVEAAITAAQNGTWVYAVGYGAESSGCDTDTGLFASPCYAMQHIANSPGNYPDPSKFYSDTNQAGGDSSCASSAHPITALDQIFTNIAGDFTTPRLIPNGTT
jgi:Flp pilus assembly protein TadG